jgi:hypothetical protein
LDPDAVLAAQREAVRDWQLGVIAKDATAQHDALVRAITAAHALDGWLSLGGFLPTAWHTHRTHS